MGYCFLKLDKLEEARVCVQQGVETVVNGQPWLFCFNCDTCFQDLVPCAAYICATCSDNVIYYECYPKRATAFQPRECDLTHQYVEVGGKKWRTLATGQVKEGEIFEQWLHRQRQQLGVELSSESIQT